VIRKLTVALAVGYVLTCGFAFADAFAPQAHSQVLERIAWLVQKNYVYKELRRKLLQRYAAGRTIPSWCVQTIRATLRRS
jgi:hypothetical protein